MNNIAFPSKADHQHTGYTLFCFCGRDLDPMTLMYEFLPRYSEDVLAHQVNILGQDVQHSI